MQKTKIINWGVPLLLIFVAIALLVFYPSPDNTNIKKKNQPKVVVEVFDSRTLSEKLTAQFFNGSSESQQQQIDALANSLDYINKFETTTSRTIIEKLNKNNIHGSIKSLIQLAGQQTLPAETANIWVGIGNIQNLTSANQAIQAYQKANNIDENNSDAWVRQAHIFTQLNQNARAEYAYRKVKILANNNQDTNKAKSFVNFGLLNQSKGNFDAAEQAFLKAIKINQEYGSQLDLAKTSYHLANLYKHFKRTKNAEKYYLKAITTYDELGQELDLAQIHSELGKLYLATNKIENAKKQLEKSLDISIQNNLQSNLAELYNSLGLISQQSGDLEKSKQYFEKALFVNKDIKKLRGMADQYSNLAMLNRTQKKYEDAEKYQMRAISLYEQIRLPNHALGQKINLGFIYRVSGRNDDACSTWKNLIPTLKSTKDNRLSRVTTLIQQNCR